MDDCGFLGGDYVVCVLRRDIKVPAWLSEDSSAVCLEFTGSGHKVLLSMTPHAADELVAVVTKKTRELRAIQVESAHAEGGDQ